MSKERLVPCITVARSREKDACPKKSAEIHVTQGRSSERLTCSAKPDTSVAEGEQVRSRSTVRFLVLMIACFSLAISASAKWKYFRSGSAADSNAVPRAGFALMGGGEQQPACRFLCEHANHGDFLILRADTEDEYAQQVNKEMSAVCPLNSVATIVFSDREDSGDLKIVEIIRQAEVIFLAGGDQSNYLRFWQETPVEQALNRHVAAGKPIGGSSAGLAILGEFSFASIIDTIHSPEALADPYGSKVTISRDFLRIPMLANTITDTHFVKRDRLGRLLVFMARILQDGWASSIRAIAVEENAAVLLDADGGAKVVGDGPAYFLEARNRPEVCRRKTPLRFSGVSVHRVPSGSTFNIKSWTGQAGEDYNLSVSDGKIKTSRPNQSVY
jgi:cyanophycinase